MLKMHLKRGLVAALLALTTQVASANVVMVVHPSNADAIDDKVVKRIFLGKEKKFPGGASANPVNQAADSSVRSQFDEVILERSSA